MNVMNDVAEARASALSLRSSAEACTPEHGTAASNALTMAEGSALSAKDCELILRALDVLDRDMQTELANKGQDAAAGETRSRLLIVRAKLNAMQVDAMSRRGKAQARPQRPALDGQALLRELQKALAVAKCVRLAAEYGEDDELDIADALAGLLIVMEGAAALLDQPEVAP